MAFSVTVTSAPAENPVTLAEAKSHLRVASDFTEDDTLIGLEIAAATEWVQDQVCRQLVTATRKLWLDGFPSFVPAWAAYRETRHDGAGEIALPYAPLIAVSAIGYVDPDGVSQTLAASEYQVTAGRTPARIVPAYGKAWPSTRYQLEAAWVTYTCGYGAASAVPGKAKNAVLLMTAQLYAFREPVVTGTIATKLPTLLSSLIESLKFGYRW